jgi:hypothetical protein
LDWERIFVAIENNDIAGHCSLNERDSVPDVEYTPCVMPKHWGLKKCILSALIKIFMKNMDLNK